MTNDFILDSQSGRYTEQSYRNNSKHMLPVVDYLSDLPENEQRTDMVEVQFKNTRKGYYKNVNHLPIKKGMKVAVEGNPGHDVGEVTLVGQLVILQMRKNRIDVNNFEARSVYRIATESDLEKAEEAHQREHETMIKARAIAKEMKLEMKVGDVEYQGDGQKAIFYYIADGRVDFRQLIRVYADTFHIRVEMKQIGARQEAGRIGGTGPCGRELCCSTWMTQFNSVSTGAARIQNLSPNPQKLAGQCAKLKCCLQYEVPIYEDALKAFPDRRIPLQTQDATWYYFASDPLKGEITYSTDPHQPVNLQVLTPVQAKAIIEANEHGRKPVNLGGKQTTMESSEIGYVNVVGQDEVNRFDRPRKNRENTRENKRENRDNRPRRDHHDNRNFRKTSNNDNPNSASIRRR